MSWFQYKCRECGCEFDEPHTYEERHGFTHGPFEKFSECPACGSCDYGDANVVEREIEEARELENEESEDEAC